VLLLAHIASAGLAPTATITTVAGISLAEQRLRAREIAIGGPYVLAADGKAGLYFTDQTQGVVYHAFPDGTISVIAGGASLPRMLRADAPIGDGGKALEASFQRLNGLAVDRSGSIFIADRNRVRRITPDGIITTIAGSGTCGLPGDGGPATLASICDPMGMAVDIEGNLFIVEPNQNRVRRVTPNGEISTVAGTGKEQGPLGDGGPARQATLLYPTGVAFDKAGNLYIADSGHFRVRKVSPSGEITTIAGTGREGSGRASTRRELPWMLKGTSSLPMRTASGK
jgi:sugar lactone lactonase YvrE